MIRKTVSLLLTLVLLASCLAVVLEIPAAEASGGLKITGSKVVAAGKKVTLSASKAVTWQSSDKKIATVSKKGVVKGKKAGAVKITAKAADGSKKTWKMTVYAKPAKSVKITASTKELDLNGKKSVKLKAEASPAGAAQSFTWKSSDSSVATVSSSGKVKAVGVGKAKITAAANDGSGKKKSVTITVTDSSAQGKKVGVSMPTNSLMRWSKDGTSLKKKLASAGCDVTLAFADNDIPTQIAQITSMIEDGCSVLVVAALDGGTLGSVLSKAAKKGVTVIAYDRLLMNTANVSYYVTFDQYAVGRLQGQYIKNKLKLDSADGPFTLEITAGDPSDSTGKKFFDGGMKVLKPYIDSGKLVVRSGQTSFLQVATNGWRSDVAMKRAQDILGSFYSGGKKLDAWYCVNDSTAWGVYNALKDDYAGPGWPVITGQDCDRNNVKLIKNGKQAMSVFKDTEVLVDCTVTMVKQILSGKKVKTNNKTSNGAVSVPSYLCDPIVVDKSNYKKVLIDSGYYSEDDF